MLFRAKWHPPGTHFCDAWKGATSLRFTKESVGRLQPNPDGTRRDYFDDVVPGLGVRVSLKRRLYFVMYRAPGRAARIRRRKRLGDTRTLDLVRARLKAKSLLGSVADGKDPAHEERLERQRSTTVEDLANKWVKAHTTIWRSSTLKGWQRFLDKEILPTIGGHAPIEVTREDVLGILDRIKHGVPDPKRKGAWRRKPAPVSSARCHETMRRMFKWAVSRGIVPASPCEGIETPARATKGTRTFTNDELRTLFRALPGTQVEHVVQLITYCATRSEETRSARWSDLDFERELWRIPPERSKSGNKTGNAHDVPLSKGALRVLAAIREANLKARVSASPYLFPATADRKGASLGRSEDARRSARLAAYMDKPNRAIAKLKAAIGIEGLRLHNIRRTVATRLSEHQVPVHVIEHVLGHALPELIRTYHAHVPLYQMREALGWWSDELDRILSERPAPAREERA